MVTLVVDGRMPLLGNLVGDGELPTTMAIGEDKVSAWVELSDLGKVIRDEEFAKITQFYPSVEVWRWCIMPDHIHMILRVKENLEEKIHIGRIIGGFKSGCSRAWWKISATTVSSASAVDSKPSLFESGYNDKILLHEGQLNNWKTYLDDNPRRLWIKKQNPEFFTVLHDMNIAGRRCQIVGNRFLLDIPDKVAVVVHRRYSVDEIARLREEWLRCGEHGGVLVSAAISPKEKEVLREAMNRGYKIILLRDNGFHRLYKPSGESFDACSEGRLLQISPWEYHMEKKVITRDQCLELNDIAEQLAAIDGDPSTTVVAR